MERKFWHMQIFPGFYSGNKEMMEKCARYSLKEGVIGLDFGCDENLLTEEEKKQT